ncbi:outer membrane beta-barrel protein [Wolbachia endosymbiont of Anopheles demeilloni]|uniref:outer membrane beta-barrel protein n=1 Tax=Wolbachia endosymbiont of Anopheles demeilloni TaxID=2748871 RepID=UPI001BDB2606|nr:outer membrane beta-barrel protein [Wolbachia endosymbiont of Anopheles demeilloni]UIP92313.1 outer membrane beta-barrel protein [Wolbachia endosymbiont of Anopheles demeilloni]
MKIKGLCVLALLLTSSLADAASNKASNSTKDQYYGGLNFGGGWGGGFKMKPSVVFGYNYDKNSKLELEILTDMSNLTEKAKRKVGVGLLANYRYYPNLDIDPVKLYVSAGLGGYLKAMGPNPTPAITQTVDKILNAISYTLKVGVDYEIASQIVGTAGITVGGQLIGIKRLAIPDAILELGVRYNF